MSAWDTESELLFWPIEFKTQSLEFGWFHLIIFFSKTTQVGFPQKEPSVANPVFDPQAWIFLFSAPFFALLFYCAICVTKILEFNVGGLDHC